ncbi:hypothetical protein C4572_00280 [Candidatus Parcubacteria bacterium]|nr:MAG: hypothetical protein C4572_00280 [Candidatus Parcubacteria bacterium]
MTKGVKFKTKWDLKELLPDESKETIEKEKELILAENHRFINKWKGRKDYLEDPTVLREALDEYEALNRKYGSSGGSGFYFYLKLSLDQNNPEIKAKFNDLQEFAIKIGNDLQFFEHNLARADGAARKKFLAYIGLAPYRHFLERLFAQAKYLLSDEEEKIMNLKHPLSHSNWVKMVAGFLAKEERAVLGEGGKKEKKSFSEISKLMSSPKKKVRDSAAAAFNQILEKHSDAAEHEINSVLANKKVNDELRKMPRPDLARHIDDDIESDVVDALVGSVSKRFDIPREYYALKAKLFGVKKLEYHERNVEYGKFDKKYSYVETVKMVNKAFSDLDDKFFEIAKKMAEGKIDAFPKKGKSSGAFCANDLVSQPTYVLLNHTGSLDDALTFAHEMGHAVNSELQKEKQNSLNFGSPKSTAEVASTFMEDFVLDDLMKETDDEGRLAIMMHKLNSDISTIFRQIACYEFEQELHSEFRKKGYLSKKEIGKLFQKRMAAYMGSSISQSAGSENWWIYWSHIRSFFYNYSYASGLLISKALQASYSQDPAFMEKIKEFLAAGTSASPKKIFLGMGINIVDKKFWDGGLDKVEKLLDETKALARKLKKI